MSAAMEFHDEGPSRERLLNVPLALVEDLRSDRHDKTDEAWCDVFQVCLPYRGLALWHVGGEHVVADSNQVLFVRADESYRMSGPLDGGYAEVIVTPDPGLLSEIAGTEPARLGDHPMFRRRAALAAPALQSLRARFLHWATASPHIDDLEAEESAVALLRAALQGEPRGDGRCAAGTARLIRRTKELLEAHLSRRLRLAEIGRAVGASPAYLTDTFRRVEGITLHRYLTQLRLSRAVAELPNVDDLTSLALETGFSSHSHFSASFRKFFGCTPSEFRESARGRRADAQRARVHITTIREAKAGTTVGYGARLKLVRDSRLAIVPLVKLPIT